MKKILSLLTVIFVLLSLFSFSTCAASVSYYDGGKMQVNSGETITFSEDFTELYCGAKEYVRFNDAYISTNESFDVINKVKLSDTQKTLVKNIEVSATSQGNVVWAYIEYQDGASLSVSFLSREYIDIYNDAMTEKWETANLSVYGEEPLLTVRREQLFGKKTIVSDEYYDNDMYFDVDIELKNLDFGIMKGQILRFGDKFYYLDYKEANINPEDDLYEMEEFEAYEIANEELIADLEKAEDDYYGIGLGFMEDDGFLKSVSDVFVVILFAVIPFAIFVLSFILIFKGKGVYKRLFAFISALSFAELVTTGILILYYTVNK